MRLSNAISAVAFAAITLASVGNAHGSSWLHDCARDDDAFGQCIVIRSGGHSLEYHRVHGDEVLRVFLYDGSFGPMITIEVLAPENGGPFAVLRDPQKRNVVRRYPISRQVFVGLRERILRLHAMDPGDADPPLLRDDGQEMWCEYVHQDWFGAVVSGRVVANVSGPCNSRSDAVPVLLEFATTLEPTFPILRTRDSFEYLVLRDCLHLTGDRILAAKAFVRAEDLAWGVGDEEPNEQLAVELSEPGVALYFGHLPPAIGGAAIFRALKNLHGYKPTDASAYGRTAIVRGYFARMAGNEIIIPSTEAETPTFRAYYTQTWRLGDDGNFRLAEWRVGPFGTQPQDGWE